MMLGQEPNTPLEEDLIRCLLNRDRLSIHRHSASDAAIPLSASYQLYQRGLSRS